MVQNVGGPVTSVPAPLSYLQSIAHQTQSDDNRALAGPVACSHRMQPRLGYLSHPCVCYTSDMHITCFTLRRLSPESSDVSTCLGVWG